MWFELFPFHSNTQLMKNSYKNIRFVSLLKSESKQEKTVHPRD